MIWNPTPTGHSLDLCCNDWHGFIGPQVLVSNIAFLVAVQKYITEQNAEWIPSYDKIDHWQSIVQSAMDNYDTICHV